jgi:AcrR family transcriptional regulator
MGDMARPRFLRLPAEQQRAILAAALDEFAAHGFAGASLNRIIEAAGISKGAMYYYFDGKDDLYADVLRRQLEELVREGGPMPVPADSGGDAFWSTLQEHYLRLFRLLASSPPTAALLRDWLNGPAGPSLWAAQQEAAAATMPWLTQTVEAGRRAGAVRDDIPQDLIIAMAMGMGQAMDAWLITQPPADLDAAIGTLIGMLRRALGPG